MKRIIYAIAALCLVACNKMTDDDFIEPPQDIKKPGAYVHGMLNASDYTNWHYFSFADNKVVKPNTPDDTVSIKDIKTEDIFTGEIIDAKQVDYKIGAAMGSNTDWDIAICRYMVRTNSGSAASGKGGVYTFPEGTDYHTLTALPSGATFAPDSIRNAAGMSNDKLMKPIAAVRTTKMVGMPPKYEDPPLYAFRSADGRRTYAVDFISYKNAEGHSGYVSFQFKEIK